MAAHLTIQLDGRRYERYRVQAPIYIRSVDGTTLRKLIHIESRDISAGGVSFETSQKVPLEAESRVVLSKIGDISSALIHGRVAHRERDPKTGRYTVGLEFTEFVDVTREELIAHIESWKQE